MFPDDINLSDAILLALRDAGWIGPLALKGSTAPERVYRKRKQVRIPKDLPRGLRLPRGVTWNASVGRMVARLWVGEGKTITVGLCAAVQEEIDELGKHYNRLRALRDAGATVDELQEARYVKEAA